MPYITGQGFRNAVMSWLPFVHRLFESKKLFSANFCSNSDICCQVSPCNSKLWFFCFVLFCWFCLGGGRWIHWSIRSFNTYVPRTVLKAWKEDEYHRQSSSSCSSLAFSCHVRKATGYSMAEGSDIVLIKHSKSVPITSWKISTMAGDGINIILSHL